MVFYLIFRLPKFLDIFIVISQIASVFDFFVPLVVLESVDFSAQDVQSLEYFEPCLEKRDRRVVAFHFEGIQLFYEFFYDDRCSVFQRFPGFHEVVY